MNIKKPIKTVLDAFHSCKIPCLMVSQTTIVETIFNNAIYVSFTTSHYKLTYVCFSYPRKFVFKLHKNDNNLYVIDTNVKIDQCLVDSTEVSNHILDSSQKWHNVYE